ncbi:T9SS type A sorting domain-containing protein [Lacibacter sediminis]|uniref:T9SS type A sorting domain-containing protein n=1 Tax=Lacibacter sediminis TaxID=2760713 RepID=A0A7G5XDN1_9BACT|nr:T9SS type A sorting domain-containing protein [Lacibacter sediminis]QNA43584.1 T9SS type A sorting domain-containing protein [Lacibacter sediminis]
MMNKLLHTLKGEKNGRGGKWLWRQMLFLVMFLSAFSPTGLMAQVNPVIDGNPIDWNSANFNLFAIKQYTSDAFGNGVVDNQFTEGSKDFFFANQLVWSISQTKAKNDIANAAAIIKDGILYFAGDRTSNNGDAQIGFWLYLNGTGPVTVGGNNIFSPPHVDGDVLVLADFTGGGRNATVTIYQWDDDGVAPAGQTIVPNTNNNLRTTNLVGTVAENNDNQYPIPTGWSFIQPTYDNNMFFEGTVNLTGLGVLNLCNTSFILETRSSQSITASLDDFAGGAFNVTPPALVLTGSAVCASAPGTGTITSTTSQAGASYQLYNSADQAVGAPKPGDGSGLTWTGVPIGTGYYVVGSGSIPSCTSTSNEVDVATLPNPGCEITGNNVICAGGSASFTASGGGAGATYAWTGPGGYTANTATISGLTAAGTYTVVVTNTTGCTSTCNRTLTVNPNPGCEITGNNVICAGASASFTASGGAAGATYAWTGPGGYTANTATISGLTAAGTYTVVVTNPTGCTSTCNRTLTVNPNPGCEITGNNVICAGASASFTASGGAAGATYAWTGPGGYTANTATISGLTAAGTYTVVVTNPTGCTSTCNRTLTVNPNPGCEITGNNVICAGASASFTASGGAAGATYAWTGPGGYTANTATISGLTAAGTYTVVVTNTTGCTSTCNRTLTVNPNPGCEITGNNVICAGASASFTASGGAAGATYAWTGPGGYTANTATISGLTAAGTYTVVVTNTTGCTSTCNRTLTVNPNPGCEITGNNVICAGASASFTASGGAAGATYAWTGPGGYTANTATISGLTAAGTYTVVVTNPTGCTSTCNRTLTVNPNPGCEITGNNVICAGASASFTASGGAAGATYAWTGPGGYTANTATISGLTAAGTYTVVVTNPTGCTSTCNRTLTVNPNPGCEITGNNAICVGGSTSFTASGGAAGATYAWTGPGGYTANTATISGLTAAGTYTVVVTNPTGCTSTCNRTLTVNPLPVIACTKTPSTIDITSAAHNAQFDVDLTGSADMNPDNYTYVWTEDGTGSFNFTNIKNPVYTAGPLDAGQVVSVTVTVTHKITGCSSMSECSIPVRAAESCPEVPTSEICNGSTNTYTAGRAPTANETWKWSVNNSASIDGADNAQSVKVIAGGQSFTLTLTISYANTELTPSECKYEVTVVPCGGYCTYTQGKYGNTSPACDGDGIGDGVAITYPTVVDMIKAMLGVGGVANPLVIGSNGKFITIPSTATAAELLNKSMPGGGGSRELFGSCTVDNVPLPACWTPGTNNSTTYITKQGKINNVLLSQTITLGLNLRVSGGLGDFALEAGTFATAKAEGGCGSTTPTQRSCYLNELGQLVVVNEYVYKTIPQSIIDALDCKGYDHTVGGLYQLANDALGNVDGEAGKECGASLGDITNAVGSINEGFDECRIFIGWNVGPCEIPSTRINLNSSGVINSADLAAQTVESLRVSAYPNPFAEKVSFAIVSPVSGKASLEIYNMFGQKIQTVYEGYLTAGRTQLVEFRPGSTIAAGTLVYRLNVAGKQVTGKLVNLKQ